jgi:hypothetical protein
MPQNPASFHAIMPFSRHFTPFSRHSRHHFHAIVQMMWYYMVPTGVDFYASKPHAAKSGLFSRQQKWMRCDEDRRIDSKLSIELLLQRDPSITV